MFEKTLEEMGLSPNESKIYEALLNTEMLSISQIAVKAKVHRRNVYDSMNRLIDKGLVTEVVLKGERNFKATNPRHLLELLKDKESNLKKALPEMQKRFQNIETKEHAYIYRGIEGIRHYMQDILDVGEDFYCIGGKGAWFDPRLRPFRIRFYQQLKQRKLHAYHLFDHEMREHVKKEIESPVKHHLKECRFLPPEASTNAAIDFFGDRIVTFTGLNVNKMDDDTVQFVLVSRKLVEAYKKWFWFMWDNCSED